MYVLLFLFMFGAKKVRLLFTASGLLESLSLLYYIQFFAPVANYIDSFF